MQIMLALKSHKDNRILDALFTGLDPTGKKILDTLIENGAN